MVRAAGVSGRTVDLRISVTEGGPYQLCPVMLVSDFSRAGRRRHELAFGVKAHVRSQPEVVVVVVGNAFADNGLKHNVVARRAPDAGQGSSEGVHMVLQI